MRKIRMNIDYDEVYNHYYYDEFMVIPELPEVGNNFENSKVVYIERADLDVLNNSNSDLNNYDFYYLTCHYESCDDEDDDRVGVCVEREEK